MGKIVSIHQPSYFPWFGLLDKIIKSDIFIILDNVQFNKRAFQHRTLYSNSSGKPSYLTLPVDAKNHQKNKILINQVLLKNSYKEVLLKHKHILKQRYGKFYGFKKYEAIINNILEKDYKYLIEIVMETFFFTLKIYDVKTKIIFASELNVEGTKSELMLNLTKAVGGNVYLSGQGAKAYMNDELFYQEGIKVIYQDFIHIEFDQKLKKDFQPGCMSIELPFLYSNFKEIFFTHYKNINQLKLVRSIQWKE